jgi:uncharacterized protein Smg (DUF494 family)
MSFAEVLNELPALSIEQRQLLITRALELDELPLSAEDESLIEERLAAHHHNPASSVPLAEMKASLQNRFQK